MTYRERLERKLEKRQEWAESRATKSDAAHAKVHAIADGIPFGQPILVGHHSEKRARRDQERMQKGMSASVEHLRAAVDHSSAAQEIERQLAGSVFSDDPDAVERLEAQIVGLEAERDRAKAYNVSCRKGAPDETLLDESQRENLATLRRVASYQLGTNGSLPSYSISYLTTRIREKRRRVEQITRLQAAADAGIRIGGRVMASRYGGTCPDCGEDFAKGDQICWYRSTREATHAVCPTKEEE